MKRIIALALVLTMVVLVLASCGGGGDIVGKWEVEQEGLTMTFEFKKDGTGSIGAMGVSANMKWETNGDKITLSAPDMFGDESQEGTYKISGKTLTLTFDGESQELKRAD